MSSLDRRQFVSAVGVGAAGVLTGGQAALGQAGAQASVHQVKPLAFAPDALRGISAQVVNLHHGKHYAAYVTKRNEIDAQLAKLNPGGPDFDARVYAGIKRDEAFNASGMILHEVYFDNLGGDGKPGDGPVEAAIKECFGSLEQWVATMKAIGGAATGWALLCLDPSDSRPHAYLVDQHQFGAVWGAVPVVALDVFEHAYYLDYQSDRPKYMGVFFDNLHWGRINERYRAAAG